MGLSNMRLCAEQLTGFSGEPSGKDTACHLGQKTANDQAKQEEGSLSSDHETNVSYSYYDDDDDDDDDDTLTIADRSSRSSSHQISPRIQYTITAQGGESGTGEVLEEQVCLLCGFFLDDEETRGGGGYWVHDVLPSVAVLSCGHVFHAHCLERITPPHKSLDPPCFPCHLISLKL